MISPQPGRRPAVDERGSATLLVIAAIAVVLTVASAMAIVVGYLGAIRRAGQAADLAAISAGQVVSHGEPGCPSAERVARDNGARVVRCAHVGDSVEFAVTVEVRYPVGLRLPGLPREVPGRASAGLQEPAAAQST
ncbi:MAG: flp pilus-assembly TadE/G-like family protein [Propionibacteriaceae bacterium]|nr:flp pilus-assembly TadE/G-like family protein [Propionibacteriaceae bacterium]